MPKKIALWLIGAGLLAARFFLIFRYRFDSDEPQHMHIAWAWSHGYVQYRDVFDNHMPLFHLVTSPLFAIGGDDPRLLFAARMLMVPLFVLSIALVWLIARKLFDVRTAFWAAGLAAITPPFFLGSLEYRTDDLWIVCWLAALAITISSLPPLSKSIFGGLALGLAAGVSMKTTLFVAAITVAGVVTPLLTWNRGAKRTLGQIARWAATFTVCVAIVPVTIGGAFAAAGAWRPFHYGVFTHNVFPYEHAYRLLFFAPLYFIVRFIGLRLAKSEGEDGIVRKRLFIFLAASVYFVILVAFWPMTSAESYLPFYPVAAILVTPLLLRAQRVLIPATVAAALIVTTVVTARPWRNDAAAEVQVVETVLSLTSPDEPVMDLKGESVFRQRPWYFALEAITNMKLRLGNIRDDIAAALVKSHTHVVVSDSLPPQSRRFVEANYVPWGLVHVAGVRLGHISTKMHFRIGVPGTYIVISSGHSVSAEIDGHDASGGVDLAAGDHYVASLEPLDDATVIWSGILRNRG
ncbi:MAG TPA: glycosyltransferase family 39 protein [Thermoanaerobaculia bacterium]|jgi:4-amino-4-deoxy-L-arabinose transferase-like glycosyltransferase